VSEIQGSDAWRQSRCGWLGASCIADAVARTKTGWGASRSNLMARLIVERITNTTVETYKSAEMQWGIDTEPEARSAYEFYTDTDVEQVGFIRHPEITWTGASPDGYVGKDGLLEIKCPNSATHIDTILDSIIPDKYVKQMQWQMRCTDRAWADFASYDPRMPANMRLYVQRVQRDEHMIKSLEADVRVFLAELETKLSALIAKFPMSEAA
jgi:putative phage-type endonuclease